MVDKLEKNVSDINYGDCSIYHFGEKWCVKFWDKYVKYAGFITIGHVYLQGGPLVAEKKF